MKPTLLLLAAAALVAAAPAPDTAPVTAADGYVETIERLDDGVWLIRQGEPFHLQPIGNVTVIEQADGLVLIDSGGSPGSGRRIVRLLKSVSAKPVKAVVVTHWHGDHPLGLPAIKAEWPKVRVIATAATRSNLLGAPMKRYAKDAPDAEHDAAFQASLDRVDAFLTAALARADLPAAKREGYERTARELALYRRDTQGLFIVAPTETFADRLALPDAERPIEFLHPGRANTDGDAVAWLPRQRILVTGDLVVAPIPFGFGSYPADWLAALERLRGYDFRLLVPGHGAAQRDRAYLDRLAALIAEVRRQVAPFAAQGLSLEETRKRVDLSAQQRLFAGDDPWLGAWFQNYWVQPFVECAWKEARGEPIAQGEG